jgi:hypothetical protein
MPPQPFVRIAQRVASEIGAALAPKGVLQTELALPSPFEIGTS